MCKLVEPEQPEKYFVRRTSGTMFTEADRKRFARTELVGQVAEGIVWLLIAALVLAVFL